MDKTCAVCETRIDEKSGKLDGTMIRVKNEKGKNQLIYVCSKCEKDKDYIERAVVRAA